MLSSDILWQRARFFQTVRDFFLNHGYLEADTPVRLPAPAPEAHIEPVPSGGWFLQTSPELCMKRLLAAGERKIFQICKCFRDKERGRKHLPEFTMLEWYRSGISYCELMAECEDMIRFLAEKFLGSLTLKGGKADISLASPWEYLTLHQAFDRHGSIPLNEAMKRDLFEEVLVSDIEPHLGVGRPTFLYDFPARMGALARLKIDDPALAERFELYIDGLELANGFSELVDPQEQRRRFAEERNRIRKSGRTPPPMPEAFLAALPDLGECAGIALGLDRLLMLFLRKDSIDEVVPFVPEEL
jgi:lysyl-tRNA synthetase class 2